MKDSISVALEMYLFNLNGNYIVQIIAYVPVTCKTLFIQHICSAGQIYGKEGPLQYLCTDIPCTT